MARPRGCQRVADRARGERPLSSGPPGAAPAAVVWHVADLVTAFLDERRRFLHDAVFRTRLPHVTYQE